MTSTAMGAHLIMPNGEIFQLSGNCSIGRWNDAQVRLEGSNVSRQHSHIYEIGGNYQLVDVQSRNGTYVNEVKITSPVILQSGDQIRIGDHKIGFLDPASAITSEACEPLEIAPTMQFLKKACGKSVAFES